MARCFGTPPAAALFFAGLWGASSARVVLHGVEGAESFELWNGLYQGDLWSGWLLALGFLCAILAMEK